VKYLALGTVYFLRGRRGWWNLGVGHQNFIKFHKEEEGRGEGKGKPEGEGENL